MQFLGKLGIKILAVIFLIAVTSLANPLTHSPPLVAQAQEPEAAQPSFIIKPQIKNIRSDGRAFGIKIEPTRQVTADSQWFFRNPEGLAAMKALGVKTIFYGVDRNNWKALYDDVTGAPQPFPAGITYKEAVGIAKAVGAEIVPIVNITVLCESTGPPYTSANMKCSQAKPKDSVDFIKALRKETKAQRVPFKNVALGGEPYGGCAYWLKGDNCTLDNPPGQHRTSLPSEEYVKRIKLWVTEIRKVDPSLKFGAQITPNTKYCKKCDGRNWTQVVLQDAGALIDFVMLHQYFRVPDPGATDIPGALRYSYYQNQIDVNVVKKDQTAMPAQARKELMAWAPANKKQMPMWYGEFNATITESSTGEEAAQVRRQLYTGLGVAEMFMDLLAPVKVNGALNSGGSRAFIHHLFATRTFIGAHNPPGAPNKIMVQAPAWHMIAALRPFSDKDWLSAKPKKVPTNSGGRKTVVGYAARKNKKVVIALFNHDPTQTISVDLKLKGMGIKNGKLTKVGHNVSSLLDQNSVSNPNAIVPHKSSLDPGLIKPWGVDNFALAPHSLTVLEVKLK